METLSTRGEEDVSAPSPEVSRSGRSRTDLTVNRGVIAGTLLAGFSAIAAAVAEWIASGRPLISSTAAAWGVVALLGFASMLLGIGLELRRRRRERQASLLDRQAEEVRAQAERQQLMDRLLAVPPLRRGHLPMIAEVNPYDTLRVSRSNYVGQDPYVLRPAVDASLDDALSDPSSRLILLIGDSKAGKSRTAYEAARRMGPTVRLIAPRPGALVDLLNLDPPLDTGPGRAVLWLDDLERYFGEASSLDSALLDRMGRDLPNVVALGTMTTNRYHERRSSEEDIGRAARQVLDRAIVARLAVELTQTEQAEAERLYPRESFDADRGIGRQLVAAWEAEQLYADSPTVSVVGWSVVQAAIDWRRAGLTRPVPASLLRELSLSYLPNRGEHARYRDTDYAEGLRWAEEQPTGSPVKLVEFISDEPGGSYEPFDYLVEYADRQDSDTYRSIPASTWEILIHRVSPGELLNLAVAADKRGEQAVEERAFRAAAESRDPLTEPWAWLALSSILEDRNDLNAAQEVLERTIDLGDPSVTPMAQVNLGALLNDKGDKQSARILYQRASDSNHPAATPSATMNLAFCAEEQGNVREAEDAYTRAMSYGDREIVAWSAFRLGLLKEKCGDVESARLNYEKAIDHIDLEGGAAAAGALGNLLVAQGDDLGARTAYQQALGSGHKDVVAYAAQALGDLLELDDSHEAQALYQRAIDSGVDEPAAVASFKLGTLLWRRGDIEGARIALERAVRSGHLEASPRAAFHLGAMLTEQGDNEGARAAYLEAVDSGHQDVGPKAISGLALLLQESGDLDGAQALFQRAADSDHPDVAPKALINLGVVLEAQGDPEGARDAYQRAIDAGNPGGLINLGILRRDEGDIEGARTFFQQAAGSGNRVAASLAASALAQLPIDDNTVEGPD